MSRREEGFTIIELLTAISISLSLVGFVYGVYFFSIRMNRSWEKKMEIVNAGWICLNRLSRDLMLAEQLSDLSDSSATVLGAGHQSFTYRLRNGALMRNGITLNHLPARVHAFRIRPVPLSMGNMAGISEPLKPPQENTKTQGDVLLEIELVYGDGVKNVLLKTTVFPRNAVELK